MSSACRRQVEAAIAAVATDARGGFAWLGRSIPAAGDGHDHDGRSATRALAGVLYRSFYCRGGTAVADRAPRPSGSGERRRLLESLAGSVPDRVRWEGGWRLRERSDTAVVVEKDGLRMWAGAGEWLPDTRPAARGSCGWLRVPADRWSASAGFLLVEGRLLPTRDPSARRARIYLDLDPPGAHALLEATGAWNREGLPFVVKVAADPRAYDRCDTAILVVEEERVERATERILAWIPARRIRLRPGIPAFTRRIVPGVAVAADPPDGASFGMLCCGQLAGAIVHAHRQGARTLAERTRIVAARLAEAGLSVDALHRGTDLRSSLERPSKG